MRILFIISLLCLAGCQTRNESTESKSTTKQKTYPLEINGGYEMASVGPTYGSTAKYYTSLSTTSFDGKPKWQLGEPNPPLSATAAMVAGSKFLESLVAEGKFPDGASIDEINLSPFDPDKGQWYYVVNFRLDIAGGTIPFINVAVLMDGTVVAPQISDRVDIGWPLPNSEIPNRPSNLTDAEIFRQFIDNLNPDRKFAGQSVEFIGKLTKIDADHPDRFCGHYFHLVAKDGTTLIFDPPGGWVLRYDVDLVVEGQLVGYRNLNEHQPEWEGLELVPGIRANSIGVARDERQ